MPLIVRHLGDRLYGFWSLAGALIGYYDLLDFGLSIAVSQYLSIEIGRRNEAECRGVFNAALRIQTLFGAVALLATVGIAIATPWLCHDPADAHQFWRVVLLLGINAAIGFPTRVYVGVLGAELRFDIQASLAMLGLLLRSGLVFLAIEAGGGLLALASVTLIATLPVTVLQVCMARRTSPWARITGVLFDTKRAKNLFSYSVYNFLSYLADILRFQVDSVIISGMIGLAAVTHYRVASVFAQYYLQILIVSVGMLHPVFSRLYGAGNKSELERTFFFGTKVSFCISTFICIALIGWGKSLIARWMGARYEDAYLPLVVLSIAVFLDVCQKPSIDLLYATFKHRTYTYMNWAEGVLNLGFSLLLVRRFGIVGVAAGTLIGAFLIRAIVQPWWVCKVHGLDYAHYMRFLAKNLFCCGFVMGLAIAAVSRELRPEYPLLIASGLCATVIYAFGCLWLVFNKSERRQLLATLSTRIADRPEAATSAATL